MQDAVSLLCIPSLYIRRESYTSAPCRSSLVRLTAMRYFQDTRARVAIFIVPSRLRAFNILETLGRATFDRS